MVALATSTTQAAEQRVNLPGGGYVTVDPDYDLQGATPVANVGMVRWYDQNGSLVRAVHGSTANDRVGSGGVTPIGSHHFLVSCPEWDNGTVVDAGALTFSEVLAFPDGQLTIPLSSLNSVVGSATGDLVISGNVTLIGTDGFAVCCPQWDNGAATDAGAVITGGVFNLFGVFSGAVSAGNAMVGTSANDQVGSGGLLRPFGPGMVPVVHSPLWDNGGVVNAGAVTFLFLPTQYGSQYGVVSATNSLVGSSANDQIGSGGVIVAPDNGPALVHSPLWDNGAAANAGAVTLLQPPGDPNASLGAVSSTNSLVGTSANDQIGSGGIIPVPAAGAVIHSPLWDKAGAADAGAVTLIGMPGVPSTGAVSATNSLVGSSAGDQIGSGGINVRDGVGTVVSSPLWDNGSAVNAGAVTIMGWPPLGLVATGTVSSTNSLVGTSTDDQVGSGGITPMGNVGVLVQSPLWDNAGTVNAGAVTILTSPWNGGTLKGVVSATNSLVGSTTGDQVGSGDVTSVDDMGFLVSSPFWDNGSAADAGAVTMLILPTAGPGTTQGVVSAANSLVGSSAGDQVGSGGLTLVEGAGVLVRSPLWDNTGAVDAGAATLLTPPWAGTPLLSGVVSATNSLVGSAPDDQVGSGGATPVGGFGILVSSPLWDNGSSANAGAMTLMAPPLMGAANAGAVSASNSLVGSSVEDQVGSGGVVIAEGSVILVRSPLWDNGSAANAGAVTMLVPPWIGPLTVGVVSAANSVVGISAEDQVGSGGIVVLEGTAIMLRSPLWDNGGAANAGAVTMLFPPWLGPPTVGAVSAGNSWVGASANDQVGSGGIQQLEDGLFLISSPEWGGAAGALTFCWYPVSPSSGVVSASNSLVGATANDRIGSGGLTHVGDGFFLAHSPLWDNGGATNAGALTLVTPPWAGGTSQGVVSAANSLVGSSTNDQVGGTEVLVVETRSVFVVHTPLWDNGIATNAGAVTFGMPPGHGVPFQGVISAANSLVGTSANDELGSGGVTVENGPRVLIVSPLWDNGAAANAGAVTLCNFHPLPIGTLSAANSFVGTSANDQVGGGGVVPYGAHSFVVLSPMWDNGVLADAGAATLGSLVQPFIGAVSAANSYVGSTAHDQVGSGGARTFGTNLCLLHSPLWDHRTAIDAGAVTWLTEGNIDYGTELNEFNSLMGSHTNDQIGSGGITVQASPLVTIHSPNWCYGAGAVTHLTSSGGWPPPTGVVNAWNSIVGPENKEPEFALERPVGNDVAENSTHAFGNVAMGSSSPLTFTVRNKGLDDLRFVPHPGPGAYVRIGGEDAAMFSLSAAPASLMVTGDSASLTVNFSPTSPGPKTASLSIYFSIDGIVPSHSFSIYLTGTGEAVTLGSWRQIHFGSSANTGDAADNADFDRDGIPNLVEYALGLHPAQSTTGQLPQPVRSGGNFTLSVTEPGSVAGLIYGAEWSTSLAAGSWQPVTDSGTAPQHVFSVPIGANKKIFMRLKVTATP